MTADLSARLRGVSAARARTAAAALTRTAQLLAPPVIAVVLLLTVWQWATTAGLVPAELLPSPMRVLGSGITEREALLRHAVPTLTATLTGFSLSVAVAFLVATILDFSLVLRRAILPVLVVSQTLPLVALAPLVVLWFGFGLLPKILLVAFVTFFPMVVGLLRGFAAADPDAEQLLRSMGASRWRVFGLLRLPAGIPSFFSALRISITYAVVGTIFAEYAGAVAGLGVYMQSAKHVFRTDLVLAAVAVSSVLTLALFGFVALLERVAVPWVRIEQGAAR